jgi:hypothetical protein
VSATSMLRKRFSRGVQRLIAIPCFLATSAMGVLSASPRGRIVTICSSVNLLLPPPSLRSRRGMFSGFSWSETRQVSRESLTVIPTFASLEKGRPDLPIGSREGRASQPVKIC